MVLPLLAMAAPSLISTGASLLGGILGKKKDAKTAASLRTTLADRFMTGAGGLQGWAGDQGAGFNLGDLDFPFQNQVGVANMASGRAQDTLAGGVPFGIRQASMALNNQPLDLGSFLSGQQGGNALAMRSLADAFGGGFNPETIAANQLTKLRAAAAPQEQQAMQGFMQNLYSTGRGAVTGAPGAEGSVGGGRLAAAFGQGLGQADLQRQVQAQEMGIAGANASENLLKSAFGRFMDTSQFAQESGTNAFNRRRGVMEGAYGREVDMSRMPPQLAAMFQSLATSGLGNAANLQGLGLDAQGAALQVAQAGANARVGAGQNLASFMGGRSATPGLDAVSNLFGGMATPQSGQAMMDMFKNVFARGRTVLGDGGVA